MPTTTRTDSQSGEQYTENHEDKIFWFIVLTPLAAAALGLLGEVLCAAIYFFGWSKSFVYWPIVFGLIALVFSLLMMTQFTRIPPDMIGGRQLFGPKRIFADCLVFNPKMFSKLVLFPGSQQTIETTDKEGSKALIVQIQQGFNLPDGSPSSADQLVRLRVVYRLNIWDSALTVIRAFWEEFALQKGDNGYSAAFDRAFKTKVEPQVLEVLLAVSDAPLQKYSMIELLTQVEKVNTELNNPQGTLAKELAKIGVAIDVIAVEGVLDVGKDKGFIALRREAVNAELEKQTAIKSAETRLETRLKVAETDEQASIREYEAEAAKLLVQQTALDVEKMNEGIRAMTALQSIAQAHMLYTSQKGRNGEIWRKFQETSPDQVAAMVASVTETMVQPGARAAGSLYQMGGKDGDSTSNPLGEMAINLLTQVMPILQEAKMLPQGFKSPIPTKEENKNSEPESSDVKSDEDEFI